MNFYYKIEKTIIGSKTLRQQIWLIGVKRRFQQNLSYVVVASAPIHAFLALYLPLLRKILFPSHLLPFDITIVETMDSGERGTNPSTMTIINPWKGY